MDGTDGASGSYEAELAFTRPSDVGPDEIRPGLLRARSLTLQEHMRKETFDQKRCRVFDLAAEGAPAPDLVRRGFDTVDLSSTVGEPGGPQGVQDNDEAGSVPPNSKRVPS